MLVDRILFGRGGRRYAVPQLDQFFQGTPGWVSFHSQTIFLSEHAAYEAHMDDYLWKFSTAYYEVARLVGPDRAMRVILARRDADRLRCRLLAAHQVAALLKEAFSKARAGVDDQHGEDVPGQPGEELHKRRSRTTATTSRKENAMSTDPTERARRERLAEINAVPGSREALEAKYGRVWTTEELTAEFTVTAFIAPLVVVRRNSDGQVGSLEFQHGPPRLYFNWQPHKSDD